MLIHLEKLGKSFGEKIVLHDVTEHRKTEERRKELTKLVRKTSEESKVAIRSIRRDAVDQVKKLKKNNEITEDDQKKAEEDIQKLTDAAIKDIDKIDAEKEKEIMEVK